MLNSSPLLAPPINNKKYYQTWRAATRTLSWVEVRALERAKRNNPNLHSMSNLLPDSMRTKMRAIVESDNSDWWKLLSRKALQTRIQFLPPSQVQ
jgi:hypothetical protein